jgi:hypothetical protein
MSDGQEDNSDCFTNKGNASHFAKVLSVSSVRPCDSLAYGRTYPV